MQIFRDLLENYIWVHFVHMNVNHCRYLVSVDVNALFDVHTQQYISLKNLLRVVEATCDDKEMISALLENDPAEALQFVIDC